MKPDNIISSTNKTKIIQQVVMNHILLLIASGASIDFGDPSPRTFLENMVARAHKNKILNSPSLNDDTPVDVVIK